MLLGLCLVEGLRIPLDADTSSPYLQSSAAGAQGGANTSLAVLAPFTWLHVYLGKLLHTAEMVEFSPRGVLFVKEVPQSDASLAESPCLPSNEGLCRVRDGGLVLPSSVLRSGPFQVASDPQEIADPVLRLLAEVDACGTENKGRGIIYTDSADYTVTA